MKRGVWSSFTTKIIGHRNNQDNLHRRPPASSSTTCSLTTAQNETSGVKSVTLTEDVATKMVYNLQGRALGTDLNALPHGIYIVGGKKVVK